MLISRQTANRNPLNPIEADIRGLPSILAQLACLAQLRDPNTGMYLSATNGDRSRQAEAHRTMELLHERAFRQWLRLRLEEQKADISLYLSSTDGEKATVVRTWINLEPYRNFIPLSASTAERKLFLSDLELLLRLMAKEMLDKPAEAQKPADEPDLIKLGEVSAWLRVAPRTVRHWAEMGEIPAIKTGRQWRFYRSHIEEWLRSQRNE